MATYCSASDVSAFLSRPQFGPDTIPSEADVEVIIQGVEEEIDRYCGTAFRIKTVKEEYHDYKSPRFYGRPLPSFTYWQWDVRDYRWVPFRFAPVRRIDVTKGDKLEIWRGNQWEDIAITGEEGRDRDWWVDYERGILYFITRWPLRERNGVRLTYRYGRESVPPDIRLACTMMTASYMVSGTVGVFIMPEGASEASYMERAQYWMERAKEILNRYYEFRSDFT